MVQFNLLIAFTESGGGKLVVLGSSHVLSDQYIDKEDNDKLREVIFSFLTSDNLQLNALDADDPEVLITISFMIRLRSLI